MTEKKYYPSQLSFSIPERAVRHLDELFPKKDKKDIVRDAIDWAMDVNGFQLVEIMYGDGSEITNEIIKLLVITEQYEWVQFETSAFGCSISCLLRQVLMQYIEERSKYGRSRSHTV